MITRTNHGASIPVGELPTTPVPKTYPLSADSLLFLRSAILFGEQLMPFVDCAELEELLHELKQIQRKHETAQTTIAENQQPRH